MTLHVKSIWYIANISADHTHKQNSSLHCTVLPDNYRNDFFHFDNSITVQIEGKPQ